MHILYIYLIVGATFTWERFVDREEMTIVDVILWTLASPLYLIWETIKIFRGL